MDKICITCKANKTTKWYTGPLCRYCYRKQPHIRDKALLVSRRHNKANWKANKKHLSALNAKWVSENKEYFLAYQAEYRLKNKATKKLWEQNDRKTNFNRRMGDRLRNRINCSIKKGIKGGSAVRDLGCSIDELKSYLESRFQQGMSWDNWGTYGWHIDHIKPLSRYNLCIPEELKEACHYSNLQPLWAKDNLKKGDTYND